MSESPATRVAETRLGNVAAVIVELGDGAREGARLEGLLDEIVCDVTRVSVGRDAVPAAALEAALSARPAGLVLVVSADRPGLDADLLIGLAGRSDAVAVVPRDARGADWLCARYDAAPVLEAVRNGGADALAALDVAWLEGDALDPLEDGGRVRERVPGPRDRVD